MTKKKEKVNKISKEELDNILEQQKKLQELINQIGTLETQKHAALHKLADVNEKIGETKKELETNYGSVNINLEDGSYEPIEEKPEK